MLLFPSPPTFDLVFMDAPYNKGLTELSLNCLLSKGYLSVDTVKDKQVLDISASIENCLNDYYKNGGEPIKEFMPNMFLDIISLNQWKEMIEKQPILF